MEDRWYRVTETSIISQMIEDEVIILNLDKGHYYSLNGSAARIWQGIIIDNQSTDDVIGSLLNRYDAKENTLRPAVERMLEELKQENLIVETSESSANSSTPNATTPEKGLFIKPVLEKYTDMQELLLLDPIHEVDALVGWPRKKIDD